MRDKLKALAIDNLGYDEVYVENRSDMEIVALVLGYLLDAAEEQKDHSHSIS